MDEIRLNVTIEDANLILEGLGLLPFARVFGLVAKIQEQASGQLESGSETLADEASGDETSGDAPDADSRSPKKS